MPGSPMVPLRALIMRRVMDAMHEQAPDPYAIMAAGSYPRPDGQGLKGQGFLGLLPVPGGVMSEYSIAESDRLRQGDPAYQEGYEDYPTLVPTLTAAELSQVMNGQVSDAVKRKAEAHALARRAQGLPLFAEPWEQRRDLFPTFRRVPR